MSKSLKLYGSTGLAAAALLTGAYNFADRNVVKMPEETVRVEMTADHDFGLIAAAEAQEAMMEGKLGLGRVALPEEVAAWDHDVRPDGKGLPVGSGDVLTGEEVFAENCAICHGDFAEGVDNWPKLAGGADTLADEDPLKTVGSYWPYLSTAWDYVHRSMPFGAAQTMSNDDVYAIVAYILYSNDLVDEDFVLSNENFLEVEMPNADGFIIDNRAETEYAIWSGEPCMENCKENVEITMRALVLDVTPDVEGEEEEAAAPAAAEAEAPAEEAPAEEAAATNEAPAEETATETAAAVTESADAGAALDPELVAAGENAFKKCKSCHQVGEGAKNKTGPQLNNIIGRTLGSEDGFRYSKGMVEMGEGGAVWNDETLAAFLAKPKDFVPRTKMSFAGFKKEEEIAAVIAYLKTFQN